MRTQKTLLRGCPESHVWTLACTILFCNSISPLPMQSLLSKSLQSNGDYSQPNWQLENTIRADGFSTGCYWTWWRKLNKDLWELTGWCTRGDSGSVAYPTHVFVLLLSLKCIAVLVPSTPTDGATQGMQPSCRWERPHCRHSCIFLK